MNTGLLLRSVYRAINIVPKILVWQPIQNILARNIHFICDRRKLNLTPNSLPDHSTSVILPCITPMYNSICSLKTRGVLQRRCKDCYFVSRHERLYVMCKSHPRHKQVQMKKREYKTWILTSVSQKKKRDW
ncbi:39S ribosomal protein L36, mitochondrial [Harpegnathos saltator]|uniref:Ribosomal protein n=1 Tax=Harpegnathos saltator TaxID=610380 RepID=E2BEP3_HARSA|nr:39S ribosomal protein L36, mitochondrial [Harpegnathos saltator]